MSERNLAVYAIPGTDDWLAIDIPFGLVTPPTITLHRPMVGPVVFFHASSYRLDIPEEARSYERAHNGQAGQGA